MEREENTAKNVDKNHQSEEESQNDVGSAGSQSCREKRPGGAHVTFQRQAGTGRAGHWHLGSLGAGSQESPGTDVHVHTFRGPHWCEYCANFMWGLIAQGVKCAGNFSLKS
ncbi:hypothetical protein EK904_012153 [Melospiza melodia maxima]|nr:hypothetical protein EK904_012153 [Melospiza melodia maxima]